MKLAALLLLSVVALNAAELRRTPPIPPVPVKASLTNVQEAIRTLVVLDVATTIQSHTNYAEPLAYHFRALADVFSAMSVDGTFSVEHLQAEMGKKVAAPEWGMTVESVRTALAAVYARCYAHRARASVPPMEFLAGISKTFSEAIREGIRQGGKSAVVE